MIKSETVKIVIIALISIGAIVGLVLLVKYIINRNPPPSPSPSPSGNQCVNNCYGNGKCVNNACLCNNGYYGINCENKVVPCPSGCEIHGTCLNDGICDCNPGWWGPNCQNANIPCPEVGGKVCNDHGTCDVTKGKCVCQKDYDHSPVCAADIPCPNNCSGNSNGDCDLSTGVCNCKKGFYSDDCSKSCTCVHGPCDDLGYCKSCDPGWWGTSCDKPCTCVNGTCATDGTGKCVCEGGWSGKDCNLLCNGLCGGDNGCTCPDKQVCDGGKCRPCNPKPCICGEVNECGDQCSSSWKDCSNGCTCRGVSECKNGKCIMPP